MREIFKSKVARLVAALLAFIFIFISIFVVGDKVSKPETFDVTTEYLNEKKINVAEMTAIATGTSVAIAAVPGDMTTPIANKLADLSGYLLVITVLILCEKYFLTLSGMLAFKIMIPISLVSLIIYLIGGNIRYKKIAIKIGTFAIAIFLTVPGGVRVSNMVEERFEISSDYSVEAAKEDQKAIEEKSDEANENASFYEKIENKLTAGIDSAMEKAESMLNTFIDFLAIMFITNLFIPLGLFFLILHLIKTFFGADYFGSVSAGTKNMTSLVSGGIKKIRKNRD